MHYGKIETATDEDFIVKAVQLLALYLQCMIRERGRATLGLSGGSTPKPVYTELGKRGDIEWAKVWLFLVDDRYVAANHSDSNQHLIRESLLLSAPIPGRHIIFPKTQLPLQVCIEDYERRLLLLLGKDTPDIVTLGLGEDGHIASLFPPLTEEACSNERRVIHTTTPSTGPLRQGSGQTNRFVVHDRISLTLPTLAHAKVPIFLLQGERKKKVWEEMTTAATADPKRWPAHAVLGEGRATVVIGR